MRKSQRLGRLDWTALALIALYLLLRLSGLAPVAQFLTGIAAFFLVLIALFRPAQRGMKHAI